MYNTGTILSHTIAFPSKKKKKKRFQTFTGN